ncbi:MAG: hypothetical protein WCR06_10930 [bacterium]
MLAIEVAVRFSQRLQSRLLSVALGGCCGLLLSATVGAQVAPDPVALSPALLSGFRSGSGQLTTVQEDAATPPAITSSRFITLPKLRVKDVENLIDDICTELQLNHGFQRNRSTVDEAVIPVEEAVTYRAVAIGAGYQKSIIYFGYLLLPRQSPQLWIFSSVHEALPSGLEVSANAPWLDGVIKAVFAKTAEYQAHLSFQDLRSDVINLSYVDADGALYALRAMGFSAVTSDQGLFVDDSFQGGLDAAAHQGPAGGTPIDAAAAAAAAAAAGMPGQAGMGGTGGMGGGMGGGMMGGGMMGGGMMGGMGAIGTYAANLND